MKSSVPGIDLLLSRLENVRSAGPGQWMASCPAHDDKIPSLSITFKNSRTGPLFHCHATCSPESILEAASLTWADVLPPREGKADRVIAATYPYRDETGDLLFEVVRFAPKGFAQRRPDGNGGWTWNLNGARRVLYRLPEASPTPTPKPPSSWLKARRTPTASAPSASSQPATLMLAGKWRDEYSEALRGRSVTIIPDADKTGRERSLRPSPPP